MKHKHDFEPVYHPSPTPEARDLGIKAAEIRKCRTCAKEVVFVQTKETWIPLFEDPESGDQGILMA